MLRYFSGCFIGSGSATCLPSRMKLRSSPLMNPVARKIFRFLARFTLSLTAAESGVFIKAI